MKPTPHAPTARTQSKRATEVYCRRDNRVYSSCPHSDTAALCPCLHAVETADALFEPGDEEQPPT